MSEKPKSPEEWAAEVAAYFGGAFPMGAVTDLFAKAQRQEWDRAIDYVRGRWGQEDADGARSTGAAYLISDWKAAWPDAFKPKLLPCPFATMESVHRGAGLVVESGGDPERFWVHCYGCKARGPSARTSEDATDLWNEKSWRPGA